MGRGGADRGWGKGGGGSYKEFYVFATLIVLVILKYKC